MISYTNLLYFIILHAFVLACIFCYMSIHLHYFLYFLETLGFIHKISYYFMRSCFTNPLLVPIIVNPCALLPDLLFSVLRHGSPSGAFLWGQGSWPQTICRSRTLSMSQFCL